MTDAGWDMRGSSRWRPGEASGPGPIPISRSPSGTDRLMTSILHAEDRIRGMNMADEARDCPYCSAPLPTSKAKQCFHCGMDWHDAHNIVRRGLRKDAPY